MKTKCVPCSFKELTGKTIVRIKVLRAQTKTDDFEEDGYVYVMSRWVDTLGYYVNDKIEFFTECKRRYVMTYTGSFGDTLYIDHIDGEWEEIEKTPILMASQIQSPRVDLPYKCGTDDKGMQWEFYKIDTLEGGITIRWSCFSTCRSIAEVKFYEVKEIPDLKEIPKPLSKYKPVLDAYIILRLEEDSNQLGEWFSQFIKDANSPLPSTTPGSQWTSYETLSRTLQAIRLAFSRHDPRRTGGDGKDMGYAINEFILAIPDLKSILDDYMNKIDEVNKR